MWGMTELSPLGSLGIPTNLQLGSPPNLTKDELLDIKVLMESCCLQVFLDACLLVFFSKFCQVLAHTADILAALSSCLTAQPCCFCRNNSDCVDTCLDQCCAVACCVTRWARAGRTSSVTCGWLTTGGGSCQGTDRQWATCRYKVVCVSVFCGNCLILGLICMRAQVGGMCDRSPC